MDGRATEGTGESLRGHLLSLSDQQKTPAIPITWIADPSGIGDAFTEKIIKGRSYAWKDELVQKKILPRVTYEQIQYKIVAKQKQRSLRTTPWEVQSYIGHRSLVMTCNTYGHRYSGSHRVEEALTKFSPVTTG